MRGLATALDLTYSKTPSRQLSRLDVVSMVQVMHKFSHSLKILDNMRERDILLQFQAQLRALLVYVFVGIGGICIGWIMNYSGKRRKMKKAKATRRVDEGVNSSVTMKDAAVSPSRPKAE